MMQEARAHRKTNCRHHWVIDPAEGATSRGRCRLCGQSKDFFNVYEDVVAELEARGVESQHPVGAGFRRKAA